MYKKILTKEARGRRAERLVHADVHMCFELRSGNRKRKTTSKKKNDLKMKNIV